MEVKFMKVSTPTATKMLTDCMNKGYETLLKIRQDYQSHKQDAATRVDQWNEWLNAWAQETMRQLGAIYEEPSRVHNFREKKEQRFSFTSDTELTPFEHTFDTKIAVLKSYYDFIMTRSSITINNNGTINYNYQEGDDNKNEQS
jgi:hypothetical protein